MARIFEPPARPIPGPVASARAFRGINLANGVVSFLFACTGPVALILTVSIAAGLSGDDIASWIFIGFFGSALISIVLSTLYRVPLVFGWTISGTAIVGPALARYDFSDVVGAYFVTGALMFVLGVTGGFKKLMNATPTPIVMAMVAAVFLKFGVLAVDAFDTALWIALAATAAFLAFSVFPTLSRTIPPVLAALIAGAVVTVATGRFELKEPIEALIAVPKLTLPTFAWEPIIELTLPLAVSVLALQNAQGIAVLRLARHDPPVNTITIVSGAGSFLYGIFGSVCACLTGPVNAILSSSGERSGHYLGAYVWSALAIPFALFAPAITALALATPEAFIYVIGGLAMMRVLQQCFVAAFSGRFTLGALVTFTVTVTDLIPGIDVVILGIGAPFWGLVFGFLTSLLLERGDFRQKKAEAADGA